MKNILLFFSLIALPLAGCEQVIDYELEQGTEKIVIEGLVTDQPGPYTVRVSRTLGYLQNGRTPGIADAEVTNSDDKGHSEVLQAKGEGIYQTSELVGTIGNTYFFKVKVNGQEYTSQSYLKPVSILDSVTYKFKEKNAETDEGYYATIYFQEPKGKGDYYRFNIWVNEEPEDDIVAINDEVYDGNYGDPEIDISLKKGDKLRVEMLSLDRAGYDFLRVLGTMQYYTGGPFDAPPSNAPSNISNGAIGYFGASAVTIINSTVK
ncbi:DUF4249 domain-containing protein [Adhaeribacter pallidiroseus]|uniref:DUF4249 domain-containing protein n=1 Tax=Adhaeribacter pallidiroseus TaxID=2072847 RepID=A0A369QPR0_9BACT|nr:DUF4249 domain-containing protein [Adhaeribacter pallidiroseus]RDC65655.1 hypothetical protein AHMF7616_04285 [Adhaeribacter pallidiroseus]